MDLNARRRRTVALVILVVLVIGGLVGFTYGNYQFAKRNPGGNDFLVHWMGARLLITEGLSPYGDETAIRIQTMAYGRPATTGEHELRVAYPLYSIVVFAPFALISEFNLARALWMTILETALIAMAILLIRLVKWRVGIVTLAIFLVFSLTWYHAVRPLILGNVVILVALGITGTLLAIKNGADELAGVLLAFATIKPQVVLVITLFLLLWAVYNRRWRLIGWFFGTIAILSITAILLLPDWIQQNIREVLRYPSYNPPGNPGSALTVWFPGVGVQVGWIMTAILGLFILIELWKSRKAEFPAFTWAVCLTLVAGLWIGIQTDPGNYIIAFPALVMVFAHIRSRWQTAGSIINILIMITILIGIWLIFVNTIDFGYQPQQSPIMFFPLPGFLLLALYWIRPWVFYPRQPWFDLISREDKHRYL